MRNKLFLIIILVVLFVFGVLIYDFSDEMDDTILNNNWYINEDGRLYILSLSKNKFNYLDDNNQKIEEYSTCGNYQYNSNISMLKLKCKNEVKKIYVSSFNDNELV